MNNSEPWLHVREQLGVQPIVSQQLLEPLNIHIERYMCEAKSFKINPLPYPLLIVHSSGSKAEEMSEGQIHDRFYPGYSALVPAMQATHWKFTGFVDFTAFYFLPCSNDPFSQLIIQFCQERKGLVPVSDALVAAVAAQISDEIFQERKQEVFTERLVFVLLEKVWRILNAEQTIKMNPDHVQLGRIQKVVTYIQKNVDKHLTIKELASVTLLSETHFRRVFIEAIGCTPHQFITQYRIQQAKKWLIYSKMPIIAIATELGFNDQSHFTVTFKKLLGVTPGKYRQLFNRSSINYGQKLD
ncbi:helix-turn-helix transcriptional regulator [Colwellia sp. 12G3]|uniref:helix-turn-helix transcriptional regulator n=1 Tax=Colwellia sp. 12G3 TaxID=2058299 RepID=UPI0012FE85F9|nr:AraC family transcriptional regulator [Colwellia sp. 12G3]